MKVYITHCCAKKNDNLRGTGKRVTPAKLYTARPTRRFMEVCKARSVAWAVFSDKFGVWFSDVEHEWYEKNPNSVSEGEFVGLLHDFDSKLESFDEVWFYHNPGRFHPLYARVLEETKLRNKISKFSHLAQIGQGGPEMNEGPAKDMKHPYSQASYRGAKVGRAEAARILDELKLCKAYGPTGKINGRNCERFGHRDAQSGHWYWDVGELIERPRRKSSAPPEVIRRVEERYSPQPGSERVGERAARVPTERVTASHAEVGKRFRETLIQLEGAMRERIPWSQAARDRRTLGNLIHEAEEKQLLGRIRLQEARLVNEVRNALNHPTTEKVTDRDATLATEAARVIIAGLEKA